MSLACHALGEQARRFHRHHGVSLSPIEPLTVMLNLARVPTLAEP